MYIILILIITSLLTDYGSTDTNTDISKEKTRKKDIPPDSLELSPNLNSLWMYRPAPRTNLPQDEDLRQQPVQYKTPHSLTRLAKTISHGFNPFFHKVPSKVGSGEVAELQSPFNDISNFWLDERR